MKNAVAAVLVLQFFNPLVWWLSALLKRFCEHACDDRASGLAGGPKIYFTVIAHLIPCLGDAAEDPQQDDHELIERIKHMKKNKRVKRKPAWMAAVLCAVMAMSSSAMVFAAASGAVGQYEKLYEDTLVNEVGGRPGQYAGGAYGLRGPPTALRSSGETTLPPTRRRIPSAGQCGATPCSPPGPSAPARARIFWSRSRRNRTTRPSRWGSSSPTARDGIGFQRRHLS